LYKLRTIPDIGEGKWVFLLQDAQKILENKKLLNINFLDPVLVERANNDL
jgi:hypothetical protein